MFQYFGYGSNLSVVSLRAKGVDPLFSEPAVLEGWKITFDIPDFFAVEGGTGNVAATPGAVVHGVLHACRSSDLQTLDRLEAIDVSYRRAAMTVTTYGGRRVRAYVYVGIPDVLDPTLRPSARYRSILVDGASEMRLDPRYVSTLRQTPVLPRAAVSPFVPDESSARRFTLAQVGRDPSLTALYGHVFDLSSAQGRVAYVRRFLGGKDASLFMLKRLDTSRGAETFDDVVTGRLTREQRDHLTTYLHEFAREFQWVGTLDYSGEVANDVVLDTSLRRQRVSHAPSSAEGVSRTGTVSSIPPPTSGAPARAVMAESDALFKRTGDENAGFLSRSEGFMPRLEPKLALSPSHAAWDQVAAELPSLYRDLGVRRAIESLPLLDASREQLPDHDLVRAAMLLGMLSHAYHYCETRPPAEHPDVLVKPWATLRTRLQRGPAVLTYLDLIVYNWRLVDRGVADPMRVPNLRLLVPTVDNAEERVFYLTQTEILAHAAPIVDACVRAQEAVLDEDDESLESALTVIITCLQRIVRESLQQIDPNPRSRTHVDPVVWAKTVAPFAVPFEKDVQGPSGTSSPIFNTLDIFLGRKSYETFLGKEITGLRATYPPLWQRYLQALEKIDVPGYIERRGSPLLSGLLHELIDEYTGPNGFLGRHRMKVYGYIELGFKVGRSVTIGGFAGVFKDRTWDTVDGELEKARVERTRSFAPTVHHVKLAKTLSPRDDESNVHTVVLDVSGAGIRYEAADRCGVLPESAPTLVARTLAALHARGDEEVALTAEWREAIDLRHGHRGREVVRVDELLRFGAIRPMVPRVAEALHASTQDPSLARAIREGTTTRWELWDVLGMLERESGFDPRSLLTPVNGRPSEALARLLPPIWMRMYSISSVMSTAESSDAAALHLTIGRHRYASTLAGGSESQERVGTASSFLVREAGRSEPITIQIQHPSRFALPRNPATPIIMIAGGTGLSPFRGFLEERARELAAGPAWLLIGARRPEDLDAQDELLRHMQQGWLELRFAFSRSERSLEVVRERGRAVAFREIPAPPRRIQALLSDPRDGAQITQLLAPAEDGGAAAHVYICGRTGFASSAMMALERTFATFSLGDTAARKQASQEKVAQLVSERRLSMEVFSGDAPLEVACLLDASEIASHNDERAGYWVIIDRRVYDVTDFVRLHPGGAHILMAYAGTDGSDGYARTHGGHTEIDAMREMYCIGAVRDLDMGHEVREIEEQGRRRSVSLGALHRAWVALLHLVVEMENALRHDQSLQRGSTTRGEARGSRSNYKLQRAVETHERFLRTYLDVLVEDSIPALDALVRGFFGQPSDAETIASASDPLLTQTSETATADLYDAVTRLQAQDADESERERHHVVLALEVMEEEDAHLLAQCKAALQTGLRQFELHQRAILHTAGPEVHGVAVRLSRLVTDYHARCRDRLRERGWAPRFSTDLPPAPKDSSPAMQVVLSTRHYLLEQDPLRRIMLLRRTAVAFIDVGEIESANRRVIHEFKPEHQSWGVVVDMRHAPSRNDPAFEDAMRELRSRVGKSFARVALLLESAVGVLQVNRLARAEASNTFATTNESAALRFAEAG